MGVQKLVQALNLQLVHHGYFVAVTFRDDSVNLLTSSRPAHAKMERPISISAFFLFPTGSKSRLHRIPSAIVVHFYTGEPLTVVELDESGHVKYTVLGHEIEAGQVPQRMIPPRVLFACYPTEDYEVDVDTGTIETLPVRDTEQHYSFAGSTVAPGYHSEEVEWAKRSDLVSLYPEAKFIIEFLTDPE